MEKVIVIGGGASGLIAAIAAARQGAAVTVLEKMEKPGKKLLLTGSGKCNLTNTKDYPNCYQSSDISYVHELLNIFSAADTIRFFNEIGLLTRERNGYVYPYSEQAASVLEILLLELKRLGVKLKYQEEVTHIDKKDHLFTIYTKTWQYPAARVILCTGGKSFSQTGSSGDGYIIAKSFGHSIVPVMAALVPLSISGNLPGSLAGVRSRAALYLDVDGKKTDIETGELQWTDYGVSGIVVFQVSGIASRALAAGKKVQLHIDLLPEYEAAYLIEYLKEKPLVGLLQKKVTAALLKHCGDDAGKIVHMAKDIRLNVTGTRSFDAAQVTTGGIPLSETISNTLESKKTKGLFLAGEVLDVDGICGGYNLQWAWTSGYIAGTTAGRRQK